jgi:hypothetical protein
MKRLPEADCRSVWEPAFLRVFGTLDDLAHPFADETWGLSMYSGGRLISEDVHQAFAQSVVTTQDRRLVIADAQVPCDGGPYSIDLSFAEWETLTTELPIGTADWMILGDSQRWAAYCEYSLDLFILGAPAEFLHRVRARIRNPDGERAQLERTLRYSKERGYSWVDRLWQRPDRI